MRAIETEWLCRASRSVLALVEAAPDEAQVFVRASDGLAPLQVLEAFAHHVPARVRDAVHQEVFHGHAYHKLLRQVVTDAEFRQATRRFLAEQGAQFNPALHHDPASNSASMNPEAA